jgi:hypothetical protein
MIENITLKPNGRKHVETSQENFGQTKDRIVLMCYAWLTVEFFDLLRNGKVR